MSFSIFSKIVKSDKDEEVHSQLGYWPKACACNCAKMNSFYLLQIRKIPEKIPVRKLNS